MAQTHEGAIKAAAAHVGLSYEEYLAKQAAGEKWCTGCKAWHQRSAFGRDSHRSDGLATSCLDYHKRRHLENYQPRPRPAAGRRFKAARENDKMQARGRVNHLVKAGVIPDPNDLPCADCGHVNDGVTRHEYDHHLGYAAEHHEDVQAVCILCHKRRGRKSHCAHGHPLSGENVGVTAGGHRFCRTCRRGYDRGRRDATYWREYRNKRWPNGRSRKRVDPGV